MKEGPFRIIVWATDARMLGSRMSGRIKFGRCKLTGERGRFVKSHIIPEALTEITWRSQPLTQQGRHGRFIKCWTSWYDAKLVTSKGEEFLQKYDDWAINFF